MYSRILGLCKITGDTMYSLSKHIGISESTLSRLKNNGQSRISTKNLLLLANYFCVNPDWLKTGEGEKSAPGVVADTLIKDDAVCARFIQLASKLYGDSDGDVSTEEMAIYTGIPQDRLWMILFDDQYPYYTELIQLIKSDKRIDANWLMLGSGEMFKTSAAKESERIDTLLKTMSQLQQTIDAKNEIIAALHERIAQLENQLKSK